MRLDVKRYLVKAKAYHCAALVAGSRTRGGQEAPHRLPKPA